MTLFKNKYRTESNRLKNWDYSNNGFYFVTICTKNKENYFGKIRNKKMVLNEIGKITQKYWLEIPKHFLFVKLDEFVVMPNHVHGILVIDKNDKIQNNVKISKPNIPVETPNLGVSTFAADNNSDISKFVKNDNLGVSTFAADNNSDISKFVKNDNLGVSTFAADNNSDISTFVTNDNLGVSTENLYWKPGILGVIINQYKRICTIKSKKINLNFVWQPRFHDHIIRDKKELNRIRKYIVNNPLKWELDTNYSKK